MKTLLATVCLAAALVVSSRAWADGPASECSANADCAPAQCCHATSCVAKSAAPDCKGAMCTMDCRPGTMDCGGACRCVEGNCKAELAKQ